MEVRVVGTAEASATVQVKSQVAGQLLRVYFTEGQNVSKGALLFEIDSRSYVEALRQAEAAVARDRAQLKQAEATLARESAQMRNTRAEAQRYSELAKAGVISKAQHDQVLTTAEVSSEAVRAAQAAIESSKAAVDSDLAAVERAKLDISYCSIRSPLNGRTGSLLVHAGNLVKANDEALVIIHQNAPMLVVFNVPEQHLPALRSLGSQQNVRVSPQDSPSRSAQGRVSIVENEVDTTTGAIRVKASFDNRDGLLWPGQFVNVALILNRIENAIVAPAEAVQPGQQGQFVYVVKADSTVEPRVVVAGQSFERKTVIQKGLSPGETVVTDGHLRLFPGAPVKIVDARKIDETKL